MAADIRRVGARPPAGGHPGFLRRMPKSCLLTKKGLALTAPLAVFYAVEALVFKVLQGYQMNEPSPAFSAFRAWTPDLLFMAVVLILFGTLTSRSQKAVRTPAFAIFIFLITYALLITAGHYVYFSATGSPLSWDVLKYWVTNFGNTNAVISSEATLSRVLWVVAQPFVVILFLLSLRSKAARKYLDIQGRQGQPRILVLLGFFALGTAGIYLAFPSEDDSSYGAKCVALDRIQDLLPVAGAPGGLPDIPESDRFDVPWVFERDPSAPRLNVVIFIFESLSWDATDLYVPGLGTTPFLKKLAQEGMAVGHSYTVVPHTTKALIPILGGYYPYLDMEPKEALPGILPPNSLARILKSQGYATAFFQPANNFERRNQLVSNFGYDLFVGLSALRPEGFEDTNYFGKEDKIMLAPSLEWVDARKGHPFFLTYLTLSTHHNYGTPKSFPRVAYEARNSVRNRYLNAVHYVDGFLKSVIEKFGERGLLDSTLFIILGDHGEAFGEHGRRQHDLVLWEEGLRSAMVLYSPAVLPKGVEIKGTRSILDVIPTVCDVLGLRLTEGRFLGQSVLKPVPEDRKLFFAGCVRDQCLALREGPIKTIYHFGKKPAEVFDNRTDPSDRNNLAGRPPYDNEFLKTRREEMLRWSRIVNAHYAKWEKENGAKTIRR